LGGGAACCGAGASNQNISRCQAEPAAVAAAGAKYTSDGGMHSVRGIKAAGSDLRACSGRGARLEKDQEGSS
jgi:hypothetical protein